MKRAIKVAIIDNSIKPEIYRPVEHWTSYFPDAFKSFRAPLRQYPDLKQDYTHLIITGSEASIVERDAWVDEEIDIVKEALEREIPILGSCWGHQLLALVLCGSGAVRRAPVPELGWISIRIHDDQEFFGLNGNVHVFSLHFDEVIGLGSDINILASTEDCSIHAFQYRDRPVWGIQSHPEIDIPTGTALLKDFMLAKPEIEPLIRKGLDSEKKDSGSIRDILRRFLNSR